MTADRSYSGSAARLLAFLGIAGLGSWSVVGDEAPKPRPWSFEPLREHVLPEVERAGWPKRRIDSFLLASMETEGLNPAPEADGRTLARRLSFHLRGLPPTLEEVASFEIAFGQDGDAAVSAQVDAWLASPHYGERWARHWLDLARYTDVTASWLESTASAWLYRDWVVQAFNEDLGYDEFIKRQLAVDLMPGRDPEENAALGFLGLSPTYWKELQLPPEIIKGTVADEWEERVDALGRTFLGLTLGCARCHDHMSDPVTARDYYAIAGVFASVRLADRPTLEPELWTPVARARAEVAELEAEKKALGKKKPAPADRDEQVAEVERKIAAIQAATPHYHVPMANGVEEAALFVKPKDDGKHGTKLDFVGGQSRDLPLHLRGDPNQVGEIIPRGFLSAFPSVNGEVRRFSEGSGRRELAEAIVTEAAPLAARVFVNRIWRHHFGNGLVGTPSEFGNAGERPTHPALLDDLAARFVEGGWSVKWLHREILTSAAWRQAATHRESEVNDPENRLLSRMPRRRLEIEAWRDAMLVASGELDRQLGGEPVDLTAPSNRRRTIYGKIHRRDLDPMLRLHDFPDPTAHSPKRPETTTPLQLLFTLNSPFVEGRAKALGSELAAVEESGGDPVVMVYGRLFQRVPSSREREAATAFLEGKDGSGKSWAEYAQVLLGSNEFLFLD